MAIALTPNPNRYKDRISSHGTRDHVAGCRRQPASRRPGSFVRRSLIGRTVCVCVTLRRRRPRAPASLALSVYTLKIVKETPERVDCVHMLYALIIPLLRFPPYSTLRQLIS